MSCIKITWEEWKTREKINQIYTTYVNQLYSCFLKWHFHMCMGLYAYVLHAWLWYVFDFQLSYLTACEKYFPRCYMVGSVEHFKWFCMIIGFLFRSLFNPLTMELLDCVSVFHYKTQWIRLYILGGAYFHKIHSTNWSYWDRESQHFRILLKMDHCFPEE